MEEPSSGDGVINTIENVKFLVKNTDPTTSAQMNLRDVIPGNAVLTGLVLNNEGYTYELTHELHREKSKVLQNYKDAVAGGYSSVFIGDVQPSKTLCDSCKYVDEGQKVSALINVAPRDVFSVSLSFAVPSDYPADVHVTIELFQPASSIEGVIFSPNYPNAYPNEADVTWAIDLAEEHLAINATIMGFESEPDSDNLTVYDGLQTTDPVLLDVSGYPDAGISVQSTGPDMYIAFTSDASVNTGGFALKFASITVPEITTATAVTVSTTLSPPVEPDTSSCTPIYLNNTDCDISKTTVGNEYNISADTGSIRSPGYPMGYPVSSFFTWRIQTTGSVVYIKVIDVDVAPYGENVSIINPSNANWQKVIKTVEEDYLFVLMETSEVIVTFQSGPMNVGSRKRRGFYLSFWSYSPNAIDLHEYDYSWRSISSPNYPSVYDNKDDMTWTIRAPEMYSIEMEITDINLEEFYDFLYLYQVNETKSGELIAKLSGVNGGGYKYYTEKNVALVHFVTDYTTTKAGFQLRYKLASHYCSDYMNNINSTNGIFKNPDYPYYTASNRSCQWLIRVHPSKVIRFWVASYTNDHNSYVRFYDGSNTGVTQLTYFYRTTNLNFISSNNEVLIVVERSSYEYDNRAYMMTYAAVNREDAYCTKQHTLTDSSGIITSPSYPARYPPNSHCQWSIELEPASKIVVEFEFFDAYNNDILTFYDGETIFDTVLRSCGSCGADDYIVSTGNQMLVSFTTASQNSDYGFKLYYYKESQMCANQVMTITNDAGIVMSPNHPGYYPNNVRCVFNISVTPGNVIHYYFNYFYTYSPDSLVIYDGGTTNASVLATLISSRSGYTGVSSGNQITMVFTTDSVTQRAGFYMTYSTRSDSTLPPDHTYSYLPVTKEHNSYDPLILLSPGFPDPYPNEIDLVWYLEANEPGNYFRFENIHSDIDHYDFLGFYNQLGTNPLSSQRIYYSNTYYGTNSFSISSSVVTIWFHSGSKFTGQGFYLEYYFY